MGYESAVSGITLLAAGIEHGWRTDSIQAQSLLVELENISSKLLRISGCLQPGFRGNFDAALRYVSVRKDSVSQQLPGDSSEAVTVRARYNVLTLLREIRCGLVALSQMPAPPCTNQEELTRVFQESVEPRLCRPKK